MRYFTLFFVLFFVSCATPEKELSGKELLEKSIQKHDPKNQWNTAEFTLRIQEPRLGNPVRFSEVYLNNQNNTFKLLRNREDKVATYEINAEGITTVLLENEIIEDSTAINRYMLQNERVKVYQNAYHVMLGMPMSLNNDLVSKIGTVTKTKFGGRKAYKIEVELKREIFSTNWNVYLSTKDFTFLGIDIISLEDPENGERLYFDKSIQIQDITIPRMKHWYDLNDTYLGSDIIVKKLE